ncbi:hypothetical protein GCM10027256_02580 [Novispirillum itersonii subsp. nipponicum]
MTALPFPRPAQADSAGASPETFRQTFTQTFTETTPVTPAGLPCHNRLKTAPAAPYIPRTPPGQTLQEMPQWPIRTLNWMNGKPHPVPLPPRPKMKWLTP